MASPKKSLVAAMLANLGVSVTKFVVGALTGSTVMVVEGIHSLVDTGNGGLMLLGRWRSRKPACAQHQFGHGMELYFWSLVVAMVVFGGGAGVSIYEGVRAIMSPRPVSHLWPNYLVLGIAALFEGLSLMVALRELRAYRKEQRFAGSVASVVHTSKNPAIFVAVLEDAAALVGLVIAAVGLTLSHFLHAPVIDGVASILIGVVLIFEAAILGYECRSLIAGETMRPVLAADIVRVIGAHADVGELSGLRTLQLGPTGGLAVIKLRVPPELPTGELERRLQSLRRDLAREVPQLAHLCLDVEPQS